MGYQTLITLNPNPCVCVCVFFFFFWGGGSLLEGIYEVQDSGFKGRGFGCRACEAEYSTGFRVPLEGFLL